jgi:hypothetical protein
MLCRFLLSVLATALSFLPIAVAIAREGAMRVP